MLIYIKLRRAVQYHFRFLATSKNIGNLYLTAQRNLCHSRAPMHKAPEMLIPYISPFSTVNVFKKESIFYRVSELSRSIATMIVLVVGVRTWRKSNGHNPSICPSSRPLPLTGLLISCGIYIETRDRTISQYESADYYILELIIYERLYTHPSLNLI